MAKDKDNKVEETINQEIDAQTTEQPVSEETEETAAQPNQEADKIAELERQCADLADKNLRMMAEFDNYRRRTNKEKLDLMKTAGEGIFRDILPLIDDFERAKAAMQQTDDINSIREGIDLIYSKFMSFLEKNDVRPIDTENATFDTEFHEAITTIPAPAEELKGKVIDCTQKGYTLGEKVIRYAKVVVGD